MSQKVTEPSPTEVIVRVQDNGIGIAADQLPRIFDLFSQIDHSLEKSQGGLGIGLSLVKRLVEMHGGTIEARSEGSGQGAEFIVEKRFVTGQHSAALAESHWDEISAFICDGKVPSEMSTGAQHWLARDLGDNPSALWMVILAVIAGLAMLITWIPSVPLRTLALIAFAWIVAKVLTRV